MSEQEQVNADGAAWVRGLAIMDASDVKEEMLRERVMRDFLTHNDVWLELQKKDWNEAFPAASWALFTEVKSEADPILQSRAFAAYKKLKGTRAFNASKFGGSSAASRWACMYLCFVLAVTGPEILANGISKETLLKAHCDIPGPKLEEPREPLDRIKEYLDGLLKSSGSGGGCSYVDADDQIRHIKPERIKEAAAILSHVVNDEIENRDRYREVFTQSIELGLKYFKVFAVAHGVDKADNPWCEAMAAAYGVTPKQVFAIRRKMGTNKSSP